MPSDEADKMWKAIKALAEPRQVKGKWVTVSPGDLLQLACLENIMARPACQANPVEATTIIHYILVTKRQTFGRACALLSAYERALSLAEGHALSSRSEFLLAAITKAGNTRDFPVQTGWMADGTFVARTHVRRQTPDSRDTMLKRLSRCLTILIMNQGVAEREASKSAGAFLDRAGPFDDSLLEEATTYTSNALTPRELRIILEFIPEQSSLDGGEARKDIQRILVHVGFDVGYRPVNMSRICWGDHLQRTPGGWQLLNPSGTVKGETQLALLNPDACVVIDAYLSRHPEAYQPGKPVAVWYKKANYGSPMTADDISKELQDLLDRAPLSRRHTPYSLRRGNTNGLLLDGLNYDEAGAVQGKRSGVTVRIYAKLAYILERAYDAYRGEAADAVPQTWACECGNQVALHLTKCSCGRSWVDSLRPGMSRATKLDQWGPLLAQARGAMKVNP